MSINLKRIRKPVFGLISLVLVLLVTYGVLRSLLGSGYVRHKIAQEITFFFNSDLMTIHVKDSAPFGLFSVRLSDVDFTGSAREESLLFTLQELRLSTGFGLLPPKVITEFIAKISEESSVSGTVKRPIFYRNALKKRFGAKGFAGDWQVDFVKVPLTILFNLFLKLPPESLIKNVSGDLSGNLSLFRKYPFNLPNSWGETELEIQNLQVRRELINSRVPVEHDFNFSPFTFKLHFDGNKLSTDEAILLSTESGSLQIEGALADSLFGPQLDLTVSGVGEVFLLLKQIFRCSAEKTSVNLKGFEQIICF